jgi:digeranylgeranylglycerophospholipid reductase
MEEYDVVIAGCGIAGAVAGAVALKNNMHTCIIEKNRRELIGRKVCGELMTQKALNILRNETGISINEYLLKGLEMRSSSGHALHFREPLCTVDRWQLGQKLTEGLLDEGADIIHEKAVAPVGESCITGVKTSRAVHYGTITMDCSGVAAALRRKVIAYESEPLGVAYKEHVIVRTPFAAEYALLMFNKEVIPSGYMWCFPKSEYELNVGAGGLLQEKASLKQVLEKLLKTLDITVKRRESPGYGVVPLGTPLASLVYPGLLLCGDAAHHVNPLTGEGIAPAVAAGYCAGGAAAEAIKNNDVSVRGLWKYNVDFAREYGKVHTPLVVARNFLVSLSDEELTYFLENMATGDDLRELIKGKIHFNVKRKVKILLKNWKRSELLIRFYKAFKRMEKIRTLYEGYPEEPEKFSLWKQGLDRHMELTY